MRGRKGTYKFIPSPTQERFIADFGINRNWKGFWGDDLFGQEHRTARALEFRRYLQITKHYPQYPSWRYEWTNKAKKAA